MNVQEEGAQLSAKLEYIKEAQGSLTCDTEKQDETEIPIERAIQPPAETVSDAAESSQIAENDDQSFIKSVKLLNTGQNASSEILSSEAVVSTEGTNPNIEKRLHEDEAESISKRIRLAEINNPESNEITKELEEAKADEQAPVDSSSHAEEIDNTVSSTVQDVRKEPESMSSVEPSNAEKTDDNSKSTEFEVIDNDGETQTQNDMESHEAVEINRMSNNHSVELTDEAEDSQIDKINNIDEINNIQQGETIQNSEGNKDDQSIENSAPIDGGDNMDIDLSLDMQFQKAIEDHHHGLATGNNEYNQISNEDPNIPSQRYQMNESEQLKFIAESLETATTSNKDKVDDNSLFDPDLLDSNENTDDLKNSEITDTNNALTAYSTLSQTTPPLSALTQAHLNSLPLPVVAPDYLPPRIQLLVNTLPTLDNLATQLLRIVAIGPYQKVLDLVAHQDTPAGATYRDLTSLFEFTKKLYSDDDPFLTVESIAPGLWKDGVKAPSIFKNKEESIQSTLRKVNLATFLGATLGTIEVGFFYLNEFFLDVFCPYNNLNPKNSISIATPQVQSTTTTGIVGKLLKQQAVIYLDLKTQAYISAIEAGERSREEILDDIFPPNMGAMLLNRRGTKTLTPAEIDFVDRCKSRKENLANYSLEEDLSDKYEWLVFLKELFEYVSKNIGFLIWGKKGRLVNIKERGKTASEEQDGVSQGINATEGNAHSEITDVTSNSHFDQGSTEMFSEASKVSNQYLASEIQERQLHLQLAQMPGSKVRHLLRRPWSREEEKSLRHALELKGPQWSQILELFGAGGKISETLKNRTQVQLKDKARNWKMFFLKSGLPVPDYLKKVTGDLEREDRMRSNSKRGRRAINKSTSTIPRSVEAETEDGTDNVDPQLQSTVPINESKELLDPTESQSVNPNSDKPVHISNQTTASNSGSENRSQVNTLN